MEPSAEGTSHLHELFEGQSEIKSKSEATLLIYCPDREDSLLLFHF